MANTWQSADGFQQNQNVMKQALGYFAFDTALMTAGGIAGGAMSRMPTRAEMHEKRLLNQLFAHDEEMGFHSQRVSRLSGRIAEELRLPASQIRVAEHAGLGHDFGKIKIPAEILKGTRQTLTAGERAIVNTHPIHSKALLETVPYRGVLKEVPTVASQHHEHLNGTGYPYKTTGDQMGMPARVVQVADKVDAMLGPRSYQAGHTPDEIITVLRREVADNHIDPRVVDAFLRIPAVELYRIAQIGHQPIGKQYFLDMNGKTIADYAATAGSAPRLVTIAK
jgi:HD-GYP domain-containing protein (c-di-GMP phosphodiesterase class II)